LQAVRVPGITPFQMMLMCRIVTTGSQTAAGTMIDAITVAGLVDRKRYGEDRNYGAISWAIMHFLLGPLIEMKGHVVQHILIVLGGCLVLVTIFVVGTPPPRNCTQDEQTMGKKPPGVAALGDRSSLLPLLRSYFSSCRHIAFFFCAVSMKYGMAIVENLVFLLFQELSASHFVLGLSVVVTVVFEIPLFRNSKALLDRYGVVALVSAAGFCYIFRVVGYTLCPGGWTVLLLEPMHGVTIALWGTASVEIVASITPTEFAATGQAFTSLIGGIGSTLGCLLGGAMIRLYGEKMCYLVAAAIAFSGVVVYNAAVCTTQDSHTLPNETEPSGAKEQITLAEEAEESADIPISLGRAT
jgi:hypothetical protein